MGLEQTGTGIDAQRVSALPGLLGSMCSCQCVASLISIACACIEICRFYGYKCLLQSAGLCKHATNS